MFGTHRRAQSESVRATGSATLQHRGFHEHATVRRGQLERTTVNRFGQTPAPAVFGPSPRRMNCELGHVFCTVSRIWMVLQASKRTVLSAEGCRRAAQVEGVSISCNWMQCARYALAAERDEFLLLQAGMECYLKGCSHAEKMSCPHTRVNRRTESLCLPTCWRQGTHTPGCSCNQHPHG